MVGAGNVISGNVNDGVEIAGTGAIGNFVVGNLVGTNATGTRAIPNASGIEIDNGASANTIGDTAAGAGNLISGNSDDGILIDGAGTSGNVVAGNKIGTDIAGTVALPNGTAMLHDVDSGLSEGVDIASGATDNTIGGTTAGAGNLISGNDDDGVDIRGLGTMGNLVAGNLIGTDFTGTLALPNGSTADHGAEGAGIEVFDYASGNTIGGANDGNVISGNLYAGLYLVNFSADDLVEGNKIGVSALGDAGLATDVGIVIQQSDGNTIGGTAPGGGNVISSNRDDGLDIDLNSNNNLVVGNFIGTDATGTFAISNTGNGVEIAASTANTIGGTIAGAGNLISGNDGSGILIDEGAPQNLVEGNLIGTDVSGTLAIGNHDGVKIDQDSSGNTIGGQTPLARNIISGNTRDGVAAPVAESEPLLPETTLA